MRIKETEIEGLLLIEGLKFTDLRGALIKPFSRSFFIEHSKLNLEFKETWFTKSHVDVIRAMHLQVGQFACEKLVSVIQGAVIDVVLDTRKSSSTYKKWYELELNEENSLAVYIPIGCAHGYKVIRENTITMYMSTEVNVPKDDVGIKFDSFGYDWKIDHPVLSEKDKNLPMFEDFE